ncbi:DUF382-domain-containing protein [Lindgomyces ingoldianus]|uniref:DUF382-domain-containing protein n=1 Tax=Lindgomyces ingoldianus TaxID=673940 RepID=A0ACB6QBY0_9PLEO|nr:DUF382-domain-containing protein [Lindgomyces ingoldianus]KAF2463656.1 DUF382-domain-containing protein [Lindgomyces ingoldianus]
MPGVIEKGAKKSKAAYRRAQKKAKREEIPAEVTASAPEIESLTPVTSTNDTLVDGPAITTADDFLEDPLFDEFKDVLAKFQLPAVEETVKETDKPEIFLSDDDEIPDEEETRKRLSKKAKKQLNKLSIAELKALVKKPELVEWTDVSSSDPQLLVSLKAQKNVIPVPPHWSLKREYLSSKRGIEKPPFALPKFIQETGISEMRDAVLEKQAEMTLKQKQRERVQGKLGKLDIDYGKLYDAFFRRQTKPELTRYGEVYYEGKEFETNLRHLRPGELGEELKEALGMQPGAPPPWLVNQQRFGPPPSYPSLRIPGVNAPIPPGAQWGYAPGQYGKPPVSDHNQPLFGGDLFGQVIAEESVQSTQLGEPIERGAWGTLRAEGESEDEDEEEEDEEEEDENQVGEAGEADMTGTQTNMTMASMAPSEMGGIESIGGEFTLRKQRKGTETEVPGGPPRSAYQVLPEKDIQAKGFFGGEHAYDLKAAMPEFGDDNRRKRKAGDIDVSVDVDSLTRDDKLDKEALRKQYEAQKKAEAQGQWTSVDLDDMSEMIAENRKRVKRDEERRSRR